MKIKKIYNKWTSNKYELYVVFEDDSEMIAADYRNTNFELKKDVSKDLEKNVSNDVSKDLEKNVSNDLEKI